VWLTPPVDVPAGPMSTLITLAVAVFVLVLAGSLPAVKAPIIGRGVLAYAAGLLASVLLVSQAIRVSRAAPASRASQVRKYAVAGLSAATEDNVLIIDGGSYGARAIEPKTLTKALRKLGFSVRVVHLALGAANHFERYRLQEEIVGDALAKPRPGQRWLFLAEVQGGYDRRPLAQLLENQDTDRTFHYLTPDNAWYALRAIEDPRLDQDELKRPYWTVTRHTLVNTFNVGVATRLVPDSKIDPASGYVRGDRDGGYRFDGLDAVLAETRNPGPPTAVPAWLFEIREARLRALWGPFVADWIYYGVPSTNPGAIRYTRSFCRATKTKCFTPDDVELLTELDSAPLWYNAGHLSSKGAPIYTRWLAQRLVQSGALKR
jgi:hypothetical protein